MSAEASLTCWQCGGRWRAAPDRDVYECKCGLSIEGSELERIASGEVTPENAAFQQGEPWKEPEPGIRVSDRWSDIGDLSWDIARIDPAKVDKAALERACADAFEGSGLRFMQRVRPDAMSARKLLLEDGETLERQRVYALVPLGQEAEAIAAVVRFIRNKHGTGTIWAHGEVPIGPLHRRAEAEFRGAELGGVLHVVLGCYYYHRPIN